MWAVEQIHVHMRIWRVDSFCSMILDVVDTSTQLHVQTYALCHSYSIQVGGSMDLNSATGVMDGLTSRNRLAARGVTTALAS